MAEPCMGKPVLKRSLDTEGNEAPVLKRRSSATGATSSTDAADTSAVPEHKPSKEDVMAKWRSLVVTIAVMVCGIISYYAYLPTKESFNPYWLPILIAIVTVGIGGINFSRGSDRRNSALVVRGAVSIMSVSVAVRIAHEIMLRQLLPPLPTQWDIPLLGVSAAIALIFVFQRQRKSTIAPVLQKQNSRPEPAPPAAAVEEWSKTFQDPYLNGAAAWNKIFEKLSKHGDEARLNHLESLRRIYAISTDDAVRRTVVQETFRLASQGSAAHSHDSEDFLDEVTSLFQWAVQKLPEVGQLDAADILMAKTIADIQANHVSIRRIFVDHRQLRAIHPVDRETAIQKSEERASSARDGFPVIEGNGMKLSESLIASNPRLRDFESVTGFQVVETPDGYVTFEGNGRRDALVRAFGGKNASTGIQVEVRLFQFPDPDTEAAIVRRVERVRRWKKVVDV